MQSTMEQARGLIASIQTIVRGNDDNIRETVANLRIATEDLSATERRPESSAVESR